MPEKRKETAKHVRVTPEMHRKLRIEAGVQSQTIARLVDRLLAEALRDGRKRMA